jgi:rubrerythrin
MNKKIEDLFDKFEGQFDIASPEMGHFNRFENKLNSRSQRKKRWRKSYSIVAAAASVVLLLGVWLGTIFAGYQGMELAQISTEMEETQDFFVTTIANELKRVEGERNAETEQMINDSLERIARLELAYNQLSLELKENSDDQRIIMAMIDNFQQRVEILQSLLNQIEDLKSLKTQNNEEYV